MRQASTRFGKTIRDLTGLEMSGNLPGHVCTEVCEYNHAVSGDGPLHSVCVSKRFWQWVHSSADEWFG